MQATHVLAASVGTLSWNQTLIAVGIVAAAVLIAGLVLIHGRKKLSQGDPGASLARTWIAITLTIGLVLFCAFAFAVDDTSLRGTLIGGLTASAAAAVAFYFSSKSSEQGSQDILNAAFGTETVPDLHGQDRNQAASTLGRTSFKLEVDPSSSTDPTATVTLQSPVKNSTARKGSAVVVTLLK